MLTEIQHRKSQSIPFWKQMFDGTPLVKELYGHPIREQREQGDAGGNFKTPVEWPVLFLCHSNPEKPPYACQTATCHV
jgi:hypothetical protein